MQDETGNKHPHGKRRPDACRLNACPSDAGTRDIGRLDAGIPDTCPSDTCSADAGAPDVFSGYMRRRLEGHRLPVDGAWWEALEAKMRHEGLNVLPAQDSTVQSLTAKDPMVKGSTVKDSTVKGLTVKDALSEDFLVKDTAVEGVVVKELPGEPVADRDVLRDGPATPQSPGTGRSLRQKGDPGRRIGIWLAAAVLAALVWLLPFTQKERTKEEAIGKFRVEEKSLIGRDSVIRQKDENAGTILPEKALFVSEAASVTPEKALFASEAASVTPEKESSPLALSASEADTAGESGREDLLLSRQDTYPSGKDTASVVPQAPPSSPLPAADRRSQAVRQSLADAHPSSATRKPLRSAWLLAARMGTEGNLSLPEGRLSMDATGPSSDGAVQDPPFSDGTGTLPDPPSPSPELPPVLSPENFSEAEYLPPLSFGLTVRKNLTPRLGVETGLIYTYLASKFNNRGIPPEETRLELHYLGIPFNLVVNLWDHSRWNLYFMAGGMAEKGLRAAYAYTTYKNRQAHTISGKESIDGLQWSVNASIGLSYRFFGAWSLYLEPRFSYYFDSSQPASIRTDKPLGAGLGGGLRYAF